MGRRWIAAIVGGLVASLAIGWFAARTFESPTQRQARALPPVPRPIVAPVTAGLLADEITARARIAPAVAERVTVQPVAEQAVVTSQPIRRGAVIGAGIALLFVNGRPLIALPGRFPLYRDITDGMRGPDVAQLQGGLIATGLLERGIEPGTFGPATQAAVRALYLASGAEPPIQPSVAQPRSTSKRSSAPPAERPMLPKNELVVVRTLPATLASIAAVGTQVTSDRPVAVLTSGPLVAHASVAAGVVGRIRPGMDAQLISGGGPLVRARVVAAARGTAEAAGDLRDVTLRATNGSIPPSWRGRTVLARIITTLVQRRGLLVPTRAVSQDADGNAYVLKRTGSEAFARVRVTPLGSLAGRTAVKPVVA